MEKPTWTPGQNEVELFFGLAFRGSLGVFLFWFLLVLFRALLVHQNVLYTILENLSWSPLLLRGFVIGLGPDFGGSVLGRFTVEVIPFPVCGALCCILCVSQPLHNVLFAGLGLSSSGIAVLAMTTKSVRSLGVKVAVAGL
jgi:hypothetical protein